MKLSESESPTPSASSLPSLSPSPSPTPTPTPEPTPEIFTISMVGDCTLSSSQREDRFETVLNGDMSWPFSGTLEYFEDYYLSIANLEFNFFFFSLYSSKLFNFKGPSEHAKILSLGSIEYVALGNNHIMDFGQKGLDDTIAILDAEGIAHSGPNSSIIYFIDDGIRIGLYSAPWGATLEQVVGRCERLKLKAFAISSLFNALGQGGKLSGFRYTDLDRSGRHRCRSRHFFTARTLMFCRELKNILTHHHLQPRKLSFGVTAHQRQRYGNSAD